MSIAEYLAQHQREPQHLGKLVKADSVGDVGSIVVGDALRFYFSVENDTIQAAQFQVFGASGQIPYGLYFMWHGDW